MTKKCVICSSPVIDEYGKLKGTIIKVLENNKNKHLHVCSDCQKLPDFIEKAKIKGV